MIAKNSNTGAKSQNYLNGIYELKLAKQEKLKAAENQISDINAVLYKFHVNLGKYKKV